MKLLVPLQKWWRETVAPIFLSPPSISETLPIFTNLARLFNGLHHQNPKPESYILIDLTDEGSTTTHETIQIIE